MIPTPGTYAIHQAFGENTRISNCRELRGGSINQSFAVSLETGEKLFIKLNPPGNSTPGMFEAEASCLMLIEKSNTVGVPETLYADENCLIQTLFAEGDKDNRWREQLGRELALMHQAIQAEQFGFELNNYLGTSKQCNMRESNWLNFWQKNRLQPQIVQLADQLGARDKLVQLLEQLTGRLSFYLAPNQEPPVFVHGDLWSGNAVADEHGAPIIFDPAGYFAPREVEFGMMRLFGGFGTVTEAAYEEVWPFEDGSDERIEIYRLHHILNHVIIFGRCYYDSAISSVLKLL